MKLKHYIYTIAIGALMLGAGGCTDDVMDVGTGGSGSEAVTTGNFYLSLNIVQGGDDYTRGTRADGDPSGEYYDDVDHEDAQTWESDIRSAWVILTDADNDKVITALQYGNSDLLQYPKPADYDSWYKGNKKLDDQKRLEFKTWWDGKEEITSGVNAGKKGIMVYVAANLSGNITYTSGTTTISDIQEIELQVAGEGTDYFEQSGVDNEAVLNAADSYSCNNPNGVVLAKFGSKGKDIITGNGMGSGHNPFLMTNADYRNSGEETEKKAKYTVYLSEDDITLQPGETEIVINLGTVEVQRALARIDIDYSVRTASFNNANQRVEVTLMAIGLLNINRHFNLFKETGTAHTSLDTDYGFFWSEKPVGGVQRYVFDPKYAEKLTDLNALSTTWQPDYAALGAYYVNSPFVLTHRNADGTGTRNLLSNPQNYESADPVKTNRIFTPYNQDTESGYKIWSYCTPNTIHDAAKQQNGISTGVAYVARLNFLNGGAGFGTFRGNETPIYMWNGLFYWTNRDLLSYLKRYNSDDATLMDEDKRMAKALKKAIEDYTQEITANPGSLTDGQKASDQRWIDVVNQEFDGRVEHDAEHNLDIPTQDNRYFWDYLNVKPSALLARHLVDNGFSIYIPHDLSGDGAKQYNVVYYHWIKHEDNLDPDIMGPMEFGVVRNNIYKLKVTGINKIGHPIPDPEIPTDPDPVTPQTPDEINSRYISIDCKVRPWDVRTDKDVTLY